MITSIKHADYSFLFEDASKELLRLHNEGKLGDNPLTPEEITYLTENGRFTSLEQYFTRLGTLINKANNPIKYLMLPLDEPCLEVDANTRIIDIPANFKKYGAGVQGDVIAETLFLRIDRFFDSMDFLETEAYIQWKLADGTEGASKIPYMDYESEHYLGKLILVWPLTDKVTAQEGNVQFSLRFIKRQADKISYSWNSVPATITIKKALNPDAVGYSEFDDASELFKIAIENSKHTSEGDSVPAPSFEAPGSVLNFPEEEIVNLGINNNVTLRGQAWVAGQGRLSYDWKFISSTGYVTQNFGAGDVYYKTEDANPIENKVYYTKDTSVTPHAYREISFGEFPTAKAEGTEIFERFSEYKITDSTYPVDGVQSVTGRYELSAIHKLGFDAAEKKIAAVIPGPETLEFTSGDSIVENNVLKEKTGLAQNGTLITDDNKLNLSVSVDNDNAPKNAWQSMTYTWKMKNTPTGDWIVLQEPAVYANQDSKTTDSIALTDAQPGWYQVTVSSMLNRDTISIDSYEARVTKAPVAPTLKFAYDENDETVDLIDATNKTVTIEVENVDYPAPTSLYTDELIYEWVDTNSTTPITSRDGVTTDGNKLIIDGTKFDSSVSFILTCYVSNKLNGAISGTSQTGMYVVTFSGK